MERITTSWHQPLTLLPPPSSKRGAARHPAEQLGALSLCYVFQTEYRVGMASLPPDSSPHLATLQHLPQRPPHRGEQRGPQRKSWGLVFSYSSVSCFRSNREWGWPACRLTAVRTSPFCAHPPPPSSQRGAARPPAKQVEARIVPDCTVLPGVLPLSSGIPCIKITL